MHLVGYAVGWFRMPENQEQGLMTYTDAFQAAEVSYKSCCVLLMGTLRDSNWINDKSHCIIIITKI